MSFSNPVVGLGGLAVGALTHFLSEPGAPAGAGGVGGGGGGGGGMPAIAAPAPAPALALTPDGIAGLILAHSDEVENAAMGGAEWEIWLQVQLATWLRGQGFQVAREVPYGDGRACDLVVTRHGHRVAIELKVESATNSGVGFRPAITADVFKIQAFNVPDLDDRWVIAVAYSGVARRQLVEVGDHGVNLYNGAAITVAVVHADMF